MRKISLITLLTLLSIGMNAQTSFHEFVVKDLSGKEFAFDQLKGKKVLVVNTASKCGFTPQYAKLQELYDQYKDKGLVIIGFPANNFAKQEPGTNDEIQEFCSINYGVTFPMMSKVSVKGDDIHPVYRWLTKKVENGKSDSKVRWNFQKYLIDENGELLAHFSSKTKPFDSKILELLD
jgi:glutathione peroxidase